MTYYVIGREEVFFTHNSLKQAEKFVKKTMQRYPDHTYLIICSDGYGDKE